MKSQNEKRMTKEDHKQRHIELHNRLDELLADYIGHTGNLLSKTTLLEIMDWSFQQTKNPTELK